MGAVPRARYTHAFSDDPWVRGLARACGAAAAALPPGYAHGAADLAPDSVLLVTCDTDQMPFGRVERDWAAPLTRMLAANDDAVLRLIVVGCGTPLARTVTRRSLRRWWRRTRPLGHA
jgi:hypothetical protein